MASPSTKKTISPTFSAPEIKLPSDVVHAGREVCGELDLVESREFLVTNGIGGYSSLTAASSVTRSYHGLLVAALRPPLDRTLLLSRLHETATYLNRTFYLATDRRKPANASTTVPDARAPTSAASSPPRPPVSTRTTPAGDVLSPLGFLHLESFRLEGTVPVFTYTFADAVLEKRVWMKQGQNTVYVSYYLRRATDAVELELDAYCNHRNHHYRTLDRPHFDHAASMPAPTTVCVQFDTRERQRTTLSMCVEHGRACLVNGWETGFVLSEERARGLPETDANLLVARFEVALLPGGRVTFVATAETSTAITAVNGEAELALQHAHERSLLAQFADARRLAAKRRRRISQRLNRSVPILDSWRIGPADGGNDETVVLEPAIHQLVLAADQFIISRAGGKSIVAGFHWFTDWARDTMIALPGLTVVTGRFDVARSILLTFKKYISRGMLPNRFPDDGSSPQEKDYNNVDGTLWYFESIRSYHAATGDRSVLEELFPVLEDIVHHHLIGTRFGIKQDDDGLLAAGANGLALTWMDAVHGDGDDNVVTPRRGKPVELQALWFNSLHTMALFANELDQPSRAVFYTDLADRTERSFRNRFWNKSLNYCYDVVDSSDGEDDATLRPNQIIAASLNWSPLTTEQRHMVVETCAIHLVTSHAVRTLPQASSSYRGTYQGNVNLRDAAYHRGTAWVWLLGPFVIAHLRAFGDKKRAGQFLTPLLRSHLGTAGLGQMSEIFDGDAPFRPRGCIAQAWSVSEM